MSCDGTPCRSPRPDSRASRTCCSARSPDCPRSTSTTRCCRRRSAARFLLPFRQAVNDELDAPFVLVIEGSIPNEEINGEGYWTSFGNDEATGEPLTLNWWIDRLAPRRGGRGDRYLRHLRRHPRDGGKSDRLHGPRGLPRLGLSLGGWAADRQRSRLPRPARELHGDAHLAALPGGRPGADDSARRRAAAAVDLRQDGPRGLRPGRLLRAGRLREGLQLAEVPGEDRVLGPVVNCNVPTSAAGWRASAGARTWAESASAARCPGSRTSSCRSWMRRPGAVCHPR